MGIKESVLAEAGVGINMIENIGSSFGTAFIATIIRVVINQLGKSLTHNIIAYHLWILSISHYIIFNHRSRTISYPEVKGDNLSIKKASN